MDDVTFPAVFPSLPATVTELRAVTSPLWRAAGSEGDPAVRNRNRALRASSAVVVYEPFLFTDAGGAATDTDEPLEEVVGDLLSDLLHLCDALGFDPELVAERAALAGEP